MALSKKFFNLTIELIPKMVDHHLKGSMFAVDVALNLGVVVADYSASGIHFCMRNKAKDGKDWLNVQLAAILFAEHPFFSANSLALFFLSLLSSLS